ncbi:MAG: Crp/Fnr family transcriptional regulator [Gemmatimonadetes bacterium]|jgi:CRP-like cAMP-binding protein|nr:Crp/Fnr family transcriptional regulator [Gemmatimonadota bacterium]
MPAQSLPPDNLLLAALGAADRAVLQRRLQAVDLPVGLTLYEPGEPISHCWFLAAGVVSMVSDMEQGTVEIGTVGHEGMAGIALVLQKPETTTRAFMQVAGHGWQCTAADLLEAMEESPALSRLLHRYVAVLFEQVAQSVACNRLHSLEERCARWLLMVHDRVGEGVLPLKQTFLADMLGVHRPAVTLAAGALQTAGLIRYSRGKVQVVDREGLENASCPCYGIVQASFDRLLART